MEFRPCIDIHQGKVKQIVGSSLDSRTGGTIENYVSAESAAHYARMFKELDLKGGHVIMLDAAGSEYRKASEEAALDALRAFPQGMQIGGGISDSNADFFIEAGASHIILTSYVFHDGGIDYDRLSRLVAKVGKSRLVLDLSCRYHNDSYFIATDRWRKISEIAITTANMLALEEYCDEFLVHAVDVEGKSSGIDERLIGRLSEYAEAGANPVTYAGGVASLVDIALIRALGGDRINVTVGSSLSIYGGAMAMEDIIDFVL